MIKIDRQEKKIEEQMERSLKKLPFEMKKIKIVLAVLKQLNSIKKSKLNILKIAIIGYVIISLYLLFIK